MNPNVVIVVVLLCGLLIWLRYLEIKRAIGRTLARQMMPFESIQFGLLGLVTGMLFSATGQVEKTLWLATVILLTLLGSILVVRAIFPFKATIMVVLEPDPADKNALRWAAFQALIGLIALSDYFWHTQLDSQRLAVGAVFLYSAAVNLIRHYKPATLTETGYHHLGSILRWADIKAYQWIGQFGTYDILVYQRTIRRHLPGPAITYLSIPANHRSQINEFLLRYVDPATILSVVLD